MKQTTMNSAATDGTILCRIISMLHGIFMTHAKTAAAACMAILCACPMNGRADNEYSLPYEQKFTNLKGIAISGSTSAERVFEGWSIYGYSRSQTGLDTDESNGITDLALSITGYALTPAFNNMSTFAVVSFYYWCSENNSKVTFEVSVENGGTFADLQTTKTFSVSSSNNRIFSFKSLVIVGGTINTRIKFRFVSLDEGSGKITIDNIRIANCIELNESTDNSETLTAHNNHIRDVTLKRTLQKDIWNTMCLPFAVTKADVAEALGTVEAMSTFTAVKDNVMEFTNVTDDAVIAAGTPFLLRLTSVNETKTFTDREISSTVPAPVSFTNSQNQTFSFQGVYSPTDLLTDDTNVFLGTDGKLYKPSDSDHATINGMRAYFIVPEGLVSGVRIDGQDTEGIFMMTADDDVLRPWYSLDGQRQNAPQQKGIYIHDGKKVVVK